MNNPSPDETGAERIARKAAEWVLRQDRGLTAREQDELSAWLAADPRHGPQLARHRQYWQRLDRLARWKPAHGERPNPDLLAPPARRTAGGWRWVAVPLAAAAALALFFGFGRVARPSAPVAPLAETRSGPPPSSRVLEDGSYVKLNRDAALSSHFSASERRVILERGEAHFVVTKDSVRPFIVAAGGVDVRAVGTAFNVRIGAAAVEVLVTEGKVQVTGPAGGPAAAAPVTIPVLEVRQRAMVPREMPAGFAQVATLTLGEVERILAWQHRLLDFNGAPLSEVVAAFNRHNVVQLVILDSELAATRLSAAFRSDNLDGFVRLLEAGFGVRAERRGDTEIVLRREP